MNIYVYYYYMFKMFNILNKSTFTLVLRNSPSLVMSTTLKEAVVCSFIALLWYDFYMQILFFWRSYLHLNGKSNSQLCYLGLRQPSFTWRDFSEIQRIGVAPMFCDWIIGPFFFESTMTVEKNIRKLQKTPIFASM